LEVEDISERVCEFCREMTSRPTGPIGRGRRPYYGRLCRCDRELGGFPKDVNIAGVKPMAKAIEWHEKTFRRVRDAGHTNDDGSPMFHVYLANADRTIDLSNVTSLGVWGDLLANVSADGKARRTENLIQYRGKRRKDDTVPYFGRAKPKDPSPYLLAAPEDEPQNVPANVPATGSTPPPTSPDQPASPRKTLRKPSDLAK
jgi:hypothetical protein